MAEQPDPRPQTIGQVTALLTDWAQRVTRGAAVSLDPPGAPSFTEGVGLYLLDIVRDPPPRGPKPPPLQLLLRYLITTWGPDSTSVHHTLNQLVFAALATPTFEVEDRSIPAELWSTFGTVPRPSFVLRYPLRVEPYALSVPLVRDARISLVPSGTALHGRLLVPDAGPAGEAMGLSGARIEHPGPGRFTTSDASGYFHLATVLPDTSGAIHLTVQVKGQTFQETVRETGSADAPVTIYVRLPIARFDGRLCDRAGEPLAGVRVELPSQRQYAYTAADGRFTFDGLPATTSPSQIRAHSAGQPLTVSRKGGSIELRLGHSGSPVEPIVIEFSS